MRHARGLLGTTRLLIDSPAGDDPELAGALADLELVLVQLASMAPESAAAERRWLEASLQDRQLMTMLRAASSAPNGRYSVMEDER